jgi:hypothetical protein
MRSAVALLGTQARILASPMYDLLHGFNDGDGLSHTGTVNIEI